MQPFVAAYQLQAHPCWDVSRSGPKVQVKSCIVSQFEYYGIFLTVLNLGPHSVLSPSGLSAFALLIPQLHRDLIRELQFKDLRPNLM